MTTTNHIPDQTLQALSGAYHLSQSVRDKAFVTGNRPAEAEAAAYTEGLVEAVRIVARLANTADAVELLSSQ